MLKLSDIVIPWLKEKDFPLIARDSASIPGTWWLDAADGSNYKVKSGSILGAVAAIVDDATVPYVVMLYTLTRKYEYYSAADPDFFEKVEKGIRLRLEEHGAFKTADTGHSS